MLYLLLSIVSMSALMIALKIFAVKGVNTPQAIVVNYVVAVVVGLFSAKGDVGVGDVIQSSWLWLALIVGSLFFLNMNLYAVSTRKAGVAVTTIASRMALIIPIVAAAMFWNDSLSVRQIVGVSMVAVALVVIFYDRGGAKNGAASLLMPLAVFFFTGVMNTSMKYAQHLLSDRADYFAFEPTLFCGALAVAVVWYLLTNGLKTFRFDWRSVVGGICLGLFNFLATFGILHGLKHVSTGVFYSAYYVGVVVVTAIVGVLLFGERLSWRKVAGMALAVAAIVVLSI